LVPGQVPGQVQVQVPGQVQVRALVPAQEPVSAQGPVPGQVQGPVPVPVPGQALAPPRPEWSHSVTNSSCRRNWLPPTTARTAVLQAERHVGVSHALPPCGGVSLTNVR
jgi:hypothetical protein